MENIMFTITARDGLEGHLKLYLSKYFAFDDQVIAESIQYLEAILFSKMRSGPGFILYLGLEYPYVDKLYRDVYYHYYATKLQNYSRNTIRLSFFQGGIVEDDFRDPGQFAKLQDYFKGFLVLRPTYPSVIGRSVLSPGLFDNPKLYCCATLMNSVINGVKMDVLGFPHSSQDGEMMVCSETTIWSMMEYFSKKYSEYRPILPHEIHELFRERTVQRQLPSQGLNTLDMSFALKKLGFGVKYYSVKAYGAEFYNILRCYIESGIPIMVALTPPNGDGHIINIIGRTSIENIGTKRLAEKFFYDGEVQTGKVEGKKILTWHDFHDIETDIVMIDDNHAPYRLAPLNNPMANYKNFQDWFKWKDYRISHMVIPLYKRVYMEADEAKALALSFLFELNNDDENIPVIRVFLASSRSFKNAVAGNVSMTKDLKELLVSTAHPRFIWIAELSTVDLLKEEKAYGMIIMDATQPRTRNMALICYLQNNKYIARAGSSIREITLDDNAPFDMYSRNIKLFEHA